MAFIVAGEERVGSGLAPVQESGSHRQTRPFDAIWQHYQAARFIYPAKLDRLAPSLGLIRRGWPLLLESAADVFQFHAVWGDEGISSSICAFRDSASTYVVQHAASVGQPLGMLDCIRRCLETINADPGFSFAKMYYRPENRWPTRAASSIAEALTPQLCAFSTQAYLTCYPYTLWDRAVHGSADTGRHQTECSATHGPIVTRDVLAREYWSVYDLAVRVVGIVRANAFGLGTAGVSGSEVSRRAAPLERHQPGQVRSADEREMMEPRDVSMEQDSWDGELHGVNARFMEYGLRRTRRVVGAYDGERLVGFVLCYASSVPMNFSYLCSRAEVIVDPDYEYRDAAITQLAAASIVEASVRGDPVAALLVSAADVPAAVRAGYVDSGKAYSCFTWQRENSAGAPSAIRGVEQLYEHAVHSTRRR